MAIEAFSPSASVVGTITGGNTELARVLIQSGGNAQAAAAKSIESIFSSRIDRALANLGSSNTSAITDKLLREQSQLIDRKARVNEAIGVISKALDQFQYLKNHVDYLQTQLLDLEGGNLTASEVSVEWDNKLRKINQLANAASDSIEDNGLYFQKNLIESFSRTSHATQTLFAPYNSTGDTLQVDGVYLGTDYYIIDGGGEYWLSDTGFADSEAAVGTLTEYTAYPGSPTGVSDSVTDLTLNSYNASTGAIDFTTSGSANVTGTLTSGGQGLLDAWIYSDFDNQASIDQAKDDLDEAESLILLTQADFLNARATLESRTSVFSSQIAGLDKQIADELEDLQTGAQAELLATQLEFKIAAFDFALLASRGNTLIMSIMLSQDSEDFGATNASARAVSGATISVTA